MFSAVGLFLGLKSKISHEQNVIYFQFSILLPYFKVSRFNNIKKIAKSVDPLNPLWPNVLNTGRLTKISILF